MQKRKHRSKFAKVRHTFYFKMIMPDGKKHIIPKKALVIPAKHGASMLLNEPTILRSIELDGVGNTSTCPMAICTYNNKSSFPHPHGGIADLTRTRAFIASELDKFRMPVKCYCYEHNHADIVKLNDSKGGQRRLLELVRKNGPIELTFSPMRKRSAPGRSGINPKTGARRTTTGARSPDQQKRLRLHALRYADRQFGALPE